MALIKLPGGETIWFDKQGSGTPLLHIHGSAFGYRNFEKLTPLMAPHVEVINFDLPGYGESVGTGRTDSMPRLADVVCELIKALGYAKVHVHGTSYGAMIGLTLAAHHPEVIDKLVLSCFMARYDHAARVMRGTWKRAAKDSGMTAVADLTSVAGFARSFYDRPEAQAQLESMRVAFSRNTPEAMIAGTETIERTDLTPVIDKIKSPLLMLAGDEDQMTPFKPAASGVGMAQIHDMLPGSKCVVLSQCGHYLVIEQPEQAAALIVQFLKA